MRRINQLRFEYFCARFSTKTPLRCCEVNSSRYPPYCGEPSTKRTKQKMPLHRDIFWVGKQWSVTGCGMQAIDQKLKGKFDIDVSRLWEDDLHEMLAEEKWFNAKDFDMGLVEARKRYPKPAKASLKAASKEAAKETSKESKAGKVA